MQWRRTPRAGTPALLLAAGVALVSGCSGAPQSAQEPSIGVESSALTNPPDNPPPDTSVVGESSQGTELVGYSDSRVVSVSLAAPGAAAGAPGYTVMNGSLVYGRQPDVASVSMFACSSTSTGLSRDCGWRIAGYAKCTANDKITIQGTCGVGATECASMHSLMRVCAGNGSCEHAGPFTLAEVDCVGSTCAPTTVICPGAQGAITVLSAEWSSDNFASVAPTAKDVTTGAVLPVERVLNGSELLGFTFDANTSAKAPIKLRIAGVSHPHAHGAAFLYEVQEWVTGKKPHKGQKKIHGGEGDEGEDHDGDHDDDGDDDDDGGGAKGGKPHWEPLCTPRSTVALPGAWHIPAYDTRALPLTGIWNEKTGSWTYDGDKSFTFACTSGTVAKCVTFGYRPWEHQQQHMTCTKMARADYCGDGVPHTREGTRIQLWDDMSPPINNYNSAFTPAGGRFEAAWARPGAFPLAQVGAICLSHARWADMPPCCSSMKNPYLYPTLPPCTQKDYVTQKEGQIIPAPNCVNVCDSAAEAQALFGAGAVPVYDESRLNPAPTSAHPPHCSKSTPHP